MVTLTTEQLHWVLDGIDIDAMVRHPLRQYEIVGWLRHVLHELPQRAPDVGIDDLLPFNFASKTPRA